MTGQVDRLNTALAGRYVLDRVLGRGGMATVYLAEDLRHGRRVAVKVLRPDLAAILGHERFLREIATTAGFRHPHILPLFDSGVIEGTGDRTVVPESTDSPSLLFYVMPFVDGESLRDRLNRERQLPVDDAVAIAHEVADALSYAHDRGVIHRDIKPENILLESGHAVVADFGIARAADQAGADRLTETGLSLGTPHYMSPEQATGDPVDARSDLYSLGCVLYESLAGEPPFTGSTIGAVIAKHTTGERPSIRVVRDTVPAPLDAAIVKAMARLPTDRFASARAFDQAIRSAGEGSAASRRSRAWSPAAMVVLVGVLLATLVFAWGRRGDGPGAALEAGRIMVFPLVVSAGFPGPASAGEDVATMIGNTLDGTGSLRWIDGWTQLDPGLRRNIRDLSQAEALALARAQRCGYYVTGRVLALDDTTAQVLLSLYDVRDGAEVKRSAATAPPDEPWRGVRAVNALLPALIAGAQADALPEWEHRPPLAIASFLLGEAAFRRIRMDEARERFEAAVAADSSFALAALRGAQAASWVHRNEDAAALVQVAARQPLVPRDAAFVRGYQAYLEGRGDSAIAGFHQALAADDRMAVAWMQLGETWTHLLSEAGTPDDSALAAFQRAIQIDSGAVGPLFHVIQILLRRGDVERATPVVERFVRADPAPQYADQIRIIDRCVRLGTDRVPWDSLARTAPFALLVAARLLLAGGAQLACAEAGFDALVRNDTTATPEAENRRFFDLFGLANVLLAQGRDNEMQARVDSFVQRWNSGSSLFLLAAPYHPGVLERARGAARDDRETHGPSYAGLRFPIRLWELGILEAKWGNVTVAEAVADRLAAGVGIGGAERGRPLARSVRAHAALARADTARALELFAGLVPAVAPGDELSWDEALPGGADRLEYARLLSARGDHRRAIEIADVLDASWPFVYPLYLEPGLRLRLDAATALNDTRLADRLRGRLAALRTGRPRP